MENIDFFATILELIKSDKLTELEAERLMNSYTRTQTHTPTTKK